MHVIEKHKAVLGMDWVLYESHVEAKKALPKLGKGKGKYFAQKKLLRECVQGSVEGDLKKPESYYSGALLVASVADEAMVFQSVDDELVWVCAIKDGIPISGFDRVVPREEARSLMAEVMSYIPNASFYGDIDGATSSLDELIGNIPKTMIKQCSIITIELPLLPVLVTSGVVAITLGALNFYVNHWTPTIDASEIYVDTRAELLLSKAQNEQRRKEIEEMLRIKEAVISQKLDEKRIALFSGHEPVKQFEIWRNAINSLPMSINGWRTTEVACNASICNIKWARDPNAAISDGKSLFGELVENNDKGAVTSISLAQHDPDRMQSPSERINRFDYLMDLAALLRPVNLSIGRDFSPITVSEDQLLAGDSRFDTLPKTLSHDGKPIVKTYTVGKELRLSLKGSNVVYLEDAIKKINMTGIQLTEINAKGLEGLRTGGDLSVEIGGVYRVAN